MQENYTNKQCVLTEEKTLIQNKIDIVRGKEIDGGRDDRSKKTEGNNRTIEKETHMIILDVKKR